MLVTELHLRNAELRMRKWPLAPPTSYCSCQPGLVMADKEPNSLKLSELSLPQLDRFKAQLNEVSVTTLA